MFYKHLLISPSLRIVKYKWLFLIFILSALADFFSVYIEQYRMRISLESIFLICGGWFYGPWIGFLNGFFSDLVGIAWHNMAFSWIFALQPSVVGMMGGIGRYLYEKSKNWSTQQNLIVWLLFAIPLYVSSIYFLDTSSILSIFVFLFFNAFTVRYVYKNKKKYFSLYVYLNITFLLTAYIASFLIGSYGALFLPSSKNLTFSLALNARVWKEAIKICLFIIPTFYSFRLIYECKKK